LGEKYRLADLPAKTDLCALAATIKGRWICEQGSPADERSVLNFITFH
jgi:hypothetical protein